jgi:putative endonuclease
MTHPTRRRALGDEAEEIAAKWLEARGWKILARNFICKGGELDLVVERGDRIAFVEVRSRRSTAFLHPAESVSSTKRRRVARAGAIWAQRHRVIHTHFLRFDVVSVLFDVDGAATVEVIEGAFDAEGNIA